MAQLPLRFEANQGQMNPAVRYSAHAGGYTLLLTSTGPVFALPDGRRVDVSLPGSNASATIVPLDRMTTRTDYFLGDRQNWRANVPSYGRIRYAGVYPGVDVVYYGNRSQLEYDFVLQPGADPKAIRMQFGGASCLSVSSDGDLVVESGGERIVQKKPVIYQEDPVTHVRHEVAGGYKLLAKHMAGLRLDHYDRSRALVIDPTVTYTTYLGGGGTDQINAVKLGPNGLLYVAAQTDTNGILPITDNYYSASNQGLTDIFLAVIDTSAAGNFGLVYSTYIGGTNLDIPLGIDVNAQGVIYMTGTTTSTDFPMVNAFQTTGAATNVSAFVLEVDPSQSSTSALVFSSYLGGTTGNDAGNAIAVDSNGLIYVIGTTHSTDFPITASAYAPVLWGSSDMFLCQIDPNAPGIDYATYLGGEDQDDGRALALGQNGLVYFAASTLSTQFPMAGLNYNGTPYGGRDGIIGVIDVTKSGTNSLVYSTYFGGSGNDEIYALALDPKGNVLVTGYTLSNDFPVTGDAMQSQLAGNADAFVSVVNPANPFQGFLVYSTFLGGTHGDVAYGVGADPAGNIYVTGYTLSPDFPVANAPQPNWGSGVDMFLTKFRPGVAGPAAIQYSSYFGGSNTYVPTALTVGPDGTAYVVGYAGKGLPVTANAGSIQSGFGGGVYDGFIMVVAQSPAAPIPMYRRRR